MIDSKHHVKLNGILYRLAIDAEGEHYRNSGEPLRPPNAVMVQGEGRQDKFQARPDVLLWNITDWSGGEGQVRFDAENHNRHSKLVNVDPFIQPGTLRPGYKVVLPTGGPSTTSVIIKTGSDIVAVEMLYAAGIKHYVWNDGSWSGPWIWNDAALSNKPNKGSVCGDDEGNVYFQEDSTANVWKCVAGGTGTTQLTDTAGIRATATGQMTFHNNYLYWMSSYYGEIFEIDTTGTPMITPTNLWAGAAARGSASNEIGNYSDMCKANGKVYAAFVFQARGTTLYEITPTTAAGTGYVREVASYPGFFASSIWAHNGLIFLAGASSSAIVNERIILYQNPEDGTFGTVGLVRHVYQENYNGQMIGSEQANLLVSPISSGSTTAGNLRVWELDTVAGGVAQIAEYSVSAAGFQPVLSPNGILVSAGTSTYLVRKRPDGASVYADDDNCYAFSPWHDMGLSDEKILSSIVISCERLPADWSIKVTYQTSEDLPTTFNTVGTYSTTNGTGTRYAVSTDTTTAKFRSLRVVVQFLYSGAGNPTTYPLLHGIEVRAQVAKPQGVFRLLLDMSDDHSGGSQSLSGADKIANIKTAAATESVIAFQDGALDREAGQWTEYDVVIDKFEFMVEHPGEGLGYIELREVV